MKKIISIHPAPGVHWVGDGFPVRTLFSYDHPDSRATSPFLLLDYAGPAEFGPADTPRGVGQHPHRGFETVTIVYQGELEHRDSTGSGGRIGPGDVQWMTAAGGIIHEEFHSGDFTRTGGTLEMVQLWVNLSARDKLSKPRYQTILDDDIPAMELPGSAGQLRIISGDYLDMRGPANTYTPMNVWDLCLEVKGSFSLPVVEGHNALLVLLHGAVEMNGSCSLDETGFIGFSREGSGIHVEAGMDSKLLLLSGEPIEEPVVGYGPFVMNSREEIGQAIADYRDGRFGNLA